MKIGIVGTGYVGLVTGVCLADTGNEVVCCDIDSEKVARLKRGVPTIYEKQLDELLERNIKEGRISFTTSLEETVKHGEIVFLCLPTPSREDFSPDTSAIDRTIEEIIKILKKESSIDKRIIVIRSTVPIGYTRKVQKKIKEHLEDRCEVCIQPEFLRQGDAIADFLKPSRIVVGTSSQECRNIFKELFAPYLRTGNPLLFMDETSAEVVKYASNCALATRISFINEISHICISTGASIDDVRKGMGLDPRIGTHYLFPGLGFGGSCLPKDLKAMIYQQEKLGLKSILLRAVLEVNNAQKQYFKNLIHEYFNGNIAGKKIAIWGVAFKASTDDTRDSPAIEVIDFLLANSARVYAYDPEALNNLSRIYGTKLNYGMTQYDILEDADALVICTEWNEFRFPDFNKVKKLMKSPVIFDGRNLYSPVKMKELGFDYIPVSSSPVYGYSRKHSEALK